VGVSRWSKTRKTFIPCAVRRSRTEQLEHVLRAASRITEDRGVLVIGSQSILGSLPEDQLPPEPTASMEVDFQLPPGMTPGMTNHVLPGGGVPSVR